MPPKSLPPRRTVKIKTTARKSSLPQVFSRCRSGSSQDSPGAAPPTATSVATARSASGLYLKDAGLLSSPGSNSIIENSSPSGKDYRIANPIPEPQEKTKKIVARSVKKNRAGDQVQEPSVASSGSAGPAAGAEIEGSEGGGCSSVPGIMVVADAGLNVFKGKDGDEALAQVHKAAVAGEGSAKVGESRTTKKVLKKTVRIVKKIVKRRVPKRVITCSQGNGEIKGDMTALDSTEVEKLHSNATPEKVDFDGHVNIHSNGSVDKEEMKRAANICILKERDESSEPAMSKLNLVEVETVAHSDTVNIGTGEKSKINCSNALEIDKENLKEMQGHDGEISKINPSVPIETEEEHSTVNCTADENLKEIERRAEEITDIKPSVPEETEEDSEIKYTETSEIENVNLKERPGNTGEITEINPSSERVVKGESVEELRNSPHGISSHGSVADNDDGNENPIVEDQLKNGKLEIVGMKTGHCMEDLSGGSIQEGRPDGEEKNDGGLNGALALSGEMEALERRKRRRTEIFVGGLDKDAKEEDIRKWFEQVGEVKEVRLVKNSDSGKNKGFAFLRYASAADAKIALEKFSTVEICGKQCGVRPVEGNDTIYIGNINKKWKSDDVVQQLRAAKVQNIDNVIVMANPTNFEQNRGFAFIEFQTCKDAQIAFNKLQKYDPFVKHMKIKVAWAQPLVEPDEEEILKVKSVYVEYLPSSWDEAKARNFFKRFGEIESIVLAKNLPSSRRKDIAFVNYSTREAALACIEAFTQEKVDDAGLEVKVKVSLAKPFKKVKQTKQVLGTAGKEQVKEKRITSKVSKVHEPLKIKKHIGKNLESTRIDRASSTTDELLHLLRQQAQVRQPQPGSFDLNHHYASAGFKRPFSALGNHANFSGPRGLPHTFPETSQLYGSTSAFPSHLDVSLPNSQRQRMEYTLESSRGFQNDPYLETREQAAQFGRRGTYRRY